ncbi:MAG: transcription-repair coupling factor [Eubacterium sp.]|nr:transcription-repair coupling factor [Eubacterium sp.]
MKAAIQALKESAGFEELTGFLSKKTGAAKVTGCLAGQKANLAAALCGGRSMLVVSENELKAKELYEDLRLYEKDVFYYPARDVLFYQADIAGNEVTRQRLQVIEALAEQKKVIAVTSAGGCMDRLLPLFMFKNSLITVKRGDICDLESLIRQLVDIGYERNSYVEAPGQFAVRGGIADIFGLSAAFPVRIELWGDEVDSIRSFDPESQRSIEELAEVNIGPATEDIGADKPDFEKKLTVTFPELFPKDALFILDEPVRVYEDAQAIFSVYAQAMEKRLESGKITSAGADRLISPAAMLAVFSKGHCAAFSLLDQKYEELKIKESFSFAARSVNPYNNQFPLLVQDLKKWQRDGYRTILLTASRTRGERMVKDLLDEGITSFYTEADERELEPGEVMVLHGNASRGFEYPMQKFVLITESDIFGRERRKRKKKLYSGKSISDLSQLSVGDYVVHESHGLAIYRGIEKVTRDGCSRDYIKLEYAKGSCLYIQATQLEALQKYGSSEEHSQLKLNTLGGSEWQKTKARVKKAVKDIAADLIRLYGARASQTGYVYGPDTVWQKEFEEMFPFEETDDQLAAIEAVKADMESPRIMDRLICGDVGYGKTEVAIRAAFKAVQESKQVVMLAPTTILAQQHYNTFLQRMKDFPVRIDLLCRFRSPAQQKKTLADLEAGRVDIVIGTHRVLSKDVKYKDLGLLIVDEEQRFGVTHKEKIKQLKNKVDVLSLTATPIPRTLHMSLIGIRDLSVLNEPPLDRVPIQTYVSEYDEDMVREAITRELARGGQVYFVSNRIAGISELAFKVQQMVPDHVVAYAHGQMKEQELEDIMYRFINGEIDVLVSTTIIETGMDIPNVNTIIVRDAERLGLSQLYQLRGRVGRSSRTAYAFLMYRKNKMLKEEAEKRLSAIREYTELGSGIKIAMRDLEIRGVGNLLGAEQSGHMEAVGYDLYCKLLTEAVAEAKNEQTEERVETAVDISADAHIPVSYIPDESSKLDVYKRISTIRNRADYDDMLDELVDRFGEPPKCVMNLLSVSMLKAAAEKCYITEIRQQQDTVTLKFHEQALIHNEEIPALLEEYKGSLSFRPKIPGFIYRLPKTQGSRPDVLWDVGRLLESMVDRLAVKHS